MQALDSELSRSSKAGFDQAVWRERTKNLEAKKAAAAAEAAAAAAIGNGAADSDHDSDHDSAKAGSSSSQVGATTTSRISLTVVSQCASMLLLMPDPLVFSCSLTCLLLLHTLKTECHADQGQLSVDACNTTSSILR